MATSIRLQPLAREAETRDAERKSVEREFLAALRASRLFTAERALQTIEAVTDSESPRPAGADELRRRLAAVQRELTELRQGAGQTVRADALISRYVDLLTHCRDCREALIALQSVPIESPAAPEGLKIRREGNRRVLSWRAASSGKRPTGYVVQRSITSPGGAGRPPSRHPLLQTSQRRRGRAWWRRFTLHGPRYRPRTDRRRWHDGSNLRDRLAPRRLRRRPDLAGSHELEECPM